MLYFVTIRKPYINEPGPLFSRQAMESKNEQLQSIYWEATHTYYQIRCEPRDEIPNINV